MIRLTLLDTSVPIKNGFAADWQKARLARSVPMDAEHAERTKSVCLIARGTAGNAHARKLGVASARKGRCPIRKHPKNGPYALMHRYPAARSAVCVESGGN